MAMNVRHALQVKDLRVKGLNVMLRQEHDRDPKYIDYDRIRLLETQRSSESNIQIGLRAMLRVPPLP